MVPRFGRRQPLVKIVEETGEVRAACSVGDVAGGPDQAVRGARPPESARIQCVDVDQVIAAAGDG